MRTLEDVLKDPCVSMNNSSKPANSAAIKAEIKRHESLQNTINRLARQLERVPDQQLRSGLKVYLHSIQGEHMTRFSVDKVRTVRMWSDTPEGPQVPSTEGMRRALLSLSGYTLSSRV